MYRFCYPRGFTGFVLDLALNFGLFAARWRVARTGLRTAPPRTLDFFPILGLRDDMAGFGFSLSLGLGLGLGLGLSLGLA